MLSNEQERLVLKFNDFARNVGAKTAKGLPTTSFLSVDDCIQEARVGLVEAATRFDSAKYEAGADVDKAFMSFAYPRIRGAVIDASRRSTFVRRRGLEKGINFQMIPLDKSYEDNDGEMLLPSLQLTAVNDDPDFMIDFTSALKTLTEREQYVVMSFGSGITGKEIASSLGVSESRVSQINSEAKLKLKELLFV